MLEGVDLCLVFGLSCLMLLGLMLLELDPFLSSSLTLVLRFGLKVVEYSSTALLVVGFVVRADLKSSCFLCLFVGSWSLEYFLCYYLHYSIT